MEHTTLTSRSESVVSAFRFSRYDPAWLNEAGAWSDDVWTEVFDLVSEDNLLPVAYRTAEDLLVRAAIVCLGAHSGPVVIAQRIEVNNLVTARLKPIGASLVIPRRRTGNLSVDDVDCVVRASLRGQVWCELKTSRARLAVGHEMYVHVQVDSLALAEELAAGIEAMGLFVQSTQYPWGDE